MKTNPIDYIFFGGAALLSLVAAILCTLFLDMKIGGTIVIWVSCSGFMGIAGIVLITKIVSAPDWVSAQGIQVWFDDIAWFDRTGRQGFSSAIEIFVREVCKEKGIVRSDLLKHISLLRVAWTTKPISLVGWGWEVQDKAGVQQGANIMVQWLGGISKSAMIHELIHYVRQKVTGKAPDYKHEDRDWWYLESLINEKISQELPYAG